MTTEAVRPRDGPTVTDLVMRARTGDQQAWDTLVGRYAPLVWSICRRHRLDRPTLRTSPRPYGCAWWITWTGSATRTRCPAGWSPPPAANAPRHWMRRAAQARSAWS